MPISYKAQELINKAALTAAAAALPGAFIPILDIGAMGVIWTKLVKDLGREFGHHDKDNLIKKFVFSLFTGAGLYWAGSRLFTALISWTGIGAVGTVSLNAALNYIYTQRLGKYVCNLYQRPGFTFGDFARASIAGIIFAQPVASELADAAEVIASTQEVVITISSDISDVAPLDVSPVSYEPPEATDLTEAPSVQSISTPTASTSAPRFSGGYQPIELIADTQGFLPSCGLETMENMIQSANPLINNSLSDWVISQGYQLPLPLEEYQHLLSSMGIPSEWIPIDHNAIMCAVSSNNTVALIGDPHFINPHLYPQPGFFHAVTLRDPWIVNGQIVGYIGIDSNCPGKPQYWTFNQVSRMSLENQKGGGFAQRILVTKNV